MRAFKLNPNETQKSFGLSLLIHFILFGWMFIQFNVNPKIETNEPPVEITLIEPELKSLEKHNNEQDSNATVLSEKNNKSRLNRKYKDLNIAPKIDFSTSSDKFFKQSLDGTNESDESNLNTKELKYFTYFKRIRDQLKQSWPGKIKEAVKQLKLKLTGKKIATKLIIILDSTGKITKIILSSESGYNLFDAAAIESFREAYSFPNPPSELIQDGEIKLYWQFIIQL